MYEFNEWPEEASRPDGAGAVIAMGQALRAAGLGPDDIGYVNAHSTSTGHLLGAAGALEAVYSIMAMREGIVPVTLNLNEPDEAAAIFDLVPHVARPKKLNHVLSNSFGFGGVNAALVLSAVS